MGETRRSIRTRAALAAGALALALTGCEQLVGLEWAPLDEDESASSSGADDGGASTTGAGAGGAPAALGVTTATTATTGGARCDDGIENGSETEVDCGGPDCPPCDKKPQPCDDDDACDSGKCKHGKCVKD